MSVNFDSLSQALESSLIDLDLTVDDSEGISPSPVNKLEELSDSLIRGVFDHDPEVAKQRRLTLFRELPVIAFRNEPYALYRILHNFKDKNLRLDSEFIEIYLTNNRHKLITTVSVDLDQFSADPTTQGDPESAFIQEVVKYFREVSQSAPVDNETFALNIEKFKLHYQEVKSSEIYRTAITILDSGVRHNRRSLQGYEDSRTYVREQLAELEGVLDSSSGSGFVTLDDIDTNRETYHTELVTDFGNIHELNHHYGGLYTRTLTNILAPNKGGKSKFCARLTYRALTEFGTNVTYWPNENGVGIDSSQLRAIHFDAMANSGSSLSDAKLGVDWKVIENNLWASIGHPEWKEVEYAYFQELKSNPTYGKIDYIDSPMHLDNFLDIIDTSVNRNNSKLVVIDYLSRISYPKGMERHTAVERAYIASLDYAKHNNVAILTPMQIRQAYVESLAKNPDNAELRAAGAESSEGLKAADLSIMLWADTQQLTNNKMTIMSIPSRIAAPLPLVDLVTDLGTCQFFSAN